MDMDMRPDNLFPNYIYIFIYRKGIKNGLIIYNKIINKIKNLRIYELESC